MFGANAYANYDDFLSYSGKAPRTMPDEGLHGLHPSYRLYPTAEDQWVFLAVPEEKEKKRFAERLAALGIEVDIAILTRNDETTVGHLSEIQSMFICYFIILINS